MPPITGPVLFQKRILDRADMFKKLFKETQPRRFRSRVRSPRMRPAYTAETLARAIRDGVDSHGRKLDPLMPRYRLPDGDMANLIAYLKNLSIRSDPGVENKTIHFATIVSSGADPGKRKAMLDTMRKFVEWMNLDTKGDLRNPNFSPNYRTEFIKAYRYWNLSVWELDGDPATWGRQLADYYANRPVFAVISGLVEGDWAPVHKFCEANAVPCLFPHTELPVTDEKMRYSVHFNRGLELEAEVMGEFLRQAAVARPLSRIVLLHDSGRKGSVPAAALAGMLKESNGFRVERHPIADESAWRGAGLAGITPADVLIVLPGDHGPAGWRWLTETRPVAGQILLPSAMLDSKPDSIPADLQSRLRFSYPYEVPGAYHPRAFRVRAWMRTRRIDITHPRLQFNTYYAMTMVQYGLEHIVTSFSRDYLLEYVEHEAENALNPGTYPRLSLGPGQRFASKDGYMVQHRPNAKHAIVPVSPWIVP